MELEKFELHLEPSEGDAPLFSPEYQAELRGFSKQLNAKYQRAFAMDSASGGGGPLGEYIFTAITPLITGLLAIGGTWLGARLGRTLRVKFGDVEVTAKDPAELAQVLAQLQAYQDAQRAAEEKRSDAPNPP